MWRNNKGLVWHKQCNLVHRKNVGICLPLPTAPSRQNTPELPSHGRYKKDGFVCMSSSEHSCGKVIADRDLCGEDPIIISDQIMLGQAMVPYHAHTSQPRTYSIDTSSKRDYSNCCSTGRLCCAHCCCVQGA